MQVLVEMLVKMLEKSLNFSEIAVNSIRDGGSVKVLKQFIKGVNTDANLYCPLAPSLK